MKGSEAPPGRPKTKSPAGLLVPRRKRLGWTCAGVFVLISSLLAWYFYGECSARVAINAPGDPYRNTSLLGDNFLWGPVPVMQENVPAIHQTLFLSGLKDSPELDFYAFRIYYSIFRALPAPPVRHHGRAGRRQLARLDPVCVP